MPSTRSPFFLAALLCTVGSLIAVAAHAQTTWELTLIADSSAELDSFSVPAINDARQIAFVATLDNVCEGQTLYRAESTGALTPIAATSGTIASFSGDPAMNATGVVTFTATMDDGSVSVLAGNGGALVTIANTVADGLTSIDSKPFISDTGGVVVVRAVRNSDGARVILTGTGGGPPDTLLDSTGTYDPVDVAGISDSGVVAFEALAGGFKGVYRTDGVVVTPVAVESAGGLTEVEALDITNNGTVVFFTETVAGVRSLALDTSGAQTVFADTTGITFASFGPAAVAESGATAFRGIFQQGLNAIFAGGTGLYERAVAVGDALSGSAVITLDTGPEAVTNSGNFAFRAGRLDGNSGIYLATPRISDGGDSGGGALDGGTIAVLVLAAAVLRRARRVSASGGRVA
jgi:hypothetical protein